MQPLAWDPSDFRKAQPSARHTSPFAPERVLATGPASCLIASPFAPSKIRGRVYDPTRGSAEASSAIVPRQRDMHGAGPCYWKMMTAS